MLDSKCIHPLRAEELAVERLQVLSIPVPPPEETVLISRFLKTKLTILDKLEQGILGEMALLKELRFNIIDNYIAGKCINIVNIKCQ